ncbi:two-component system phosphate regulon sensor histidine kinase PhoR [Clostridiales Family XIII bacterium PM5-7]
MRNRIFKGIFGVATLVWVSCLVLIMSALYMQYTGEYSREMKNEAHLVAEAVKLSGMDYFQQVELAENNRITWIDKDGTVIYDSLVDIKEMGNHSDREEVKEAMDKGFGEDVRYSRTLSQRTMYSAIRLDDGTIIRVAQEQLSVVSLLKSMIQPILIILIIAVFLALFLASNLAKNIVKPINEIDLEHPEDAETYEEMKPLLEKISEQHEALNRQIDQLRGDVNDKIQEANYRKEFTANVSHELKTPLTSISGFAEIIQHGIAKEEDVPRFAGRIYDETQRMITLVGDIIKLSQLDEKQIHAKQERLDLHLMCSNVLRTLEAAAMAKNLQVELLGETLYINAVEQILEEIIYNVCENGIKYNVTGGALTVTVFEDAGRPAIKVSDTGIGIPEEDIGRIFERFFRVNKSHSKEIGGTGLGLSIVKHGVAYLGASIKIDSKINVGTNITIIF